MPLYGNILHKGGLGCCDGNPSQAPTQLWILVTLIGVFGAILVALSLFRSVHRLASGGQDFVLTFALVVTVTAFAQAVLVHRSCRQLNLANG